MIATIPKPRKRRGKPQKRLNRRRRESKRRQLLSSEKIEGSDLPVAQSLARQDPGSPSFYSVGIPKERVPEFPPRFSPLRPPKVGSQTFAIPALAPRDSVGYPRRIFFLFTSQDCDRRSTQFIWGWEKLAKSILVIDIKVQNVRFWIE